MAAMLTVRDCERLRDTLHEGDDFEIDTDVWDSIRDKVKKRVTTKIEGVYPHGLLLSFWHRTWKGKIKRTRWISYVQIIIERREGKVPYVYCET